jgi:hypothetical protein
MRSASSWYERGTPSPQMQMSTNTDRWRKDRYITSCKRPMKGHPNHPLLSPSTKAAINDRGLALQYSILNAKRSYQPRRAALIGTIVMLHRDPSAKELPTCTAAAQMRLPPSGCYASFFALAFCNAQRFRCASAMALRASGLSTRLTPAFAFGAALALPLVFLVDFPLTAVILASTLPVAERRFRT